MSQNTMQAIFQRSLSAQMTRLNTVASNLANANSIAGSAEEAYRPMRPVFETEFLEQGGRDGVATVNVSEIVQLDRDPIQLYQPDHPLANADGFIFQAPINAEEEMVEMIEASRQYQTTLDAMSTMRTLMVRTVNIGQ